MLILRQKTTNAEVLLNSGGLWVAKRGGQAAELLATRLNEQTPTITQKAFEPGDPITTNAVGEAIASALPDLEIAQRAPDEFVKGRIY